MTAPQRHRAVSPASLRSRARRHLSHTHPVLRARRRQVAEHEAAGEAPAWLRSAAGWTWRLLVVALGIWLAFWAVAQVTLVFVAVFIALVITGVLNPMVDWLAKVMPRGLAVTLALLSALAVFAGLLFYVVTSVMGQWSSLGNQFSDGIRQVFEYLEDGPLPFSVTYEDFQSWLENVRGWTRRNASEIANEAASRAVVVVQGFTVFALAVFCAIFFLARGRQMWEWFLGQLPNHKTGAWDDVASSGWTTFAAYTRGTVFIALTDGILCAIFLTVIHVPLAAPLAVLVFIGAFIPLIGAPAAMVIAMVVALAAGGVVKAAVVGIGIALIGQFEGHVLQPLVMSHQVRLHPVVIAVVVAAGTLVAGILGAIISVPLIAVSWRVYSRIRERSLGDLPNTAVIGTI